MENFIIEKMSEEKLRKISPQRRISAWLVHLFTASAAIFGLLTLYAIYEGLYLLSFWFMLATIFIDSVDGTLARFVKVSEAAPQIDGTLLDNLVDYLNYVITPAFFVLVSGILPLYWNMVGMVVIVLASAYQFTQADAKTPDHFFKGFPSYWNIAVLYLYISNLNPWTNFFIILFLGFMVFVPIKYLYLSRIDYVTNSKTGRFLIFMATIFYAFSLIGLLTTYPYFNPVFVYYSWAFGIFYITVSLFRTFKPMPYP